MTIGANPDFSDHAFYRFAFDDQDTGSTDNPVQTDTELIGEEVKNAWQEDFEPLWSLRSDAETVPPADIDPTVTPDQIEDIMEARRRFDRPGSPSRRKTLWSGKRRMSRYKNDYLGPYPTASPHFFEIMADQARHFNSPNAAEPYVLPEHLQTITEVPYASTERLSRTKKILKMTGHILDKTVEFTRRRRNLALMGLGIITLSSAAMVFAVTHGANSSKTSTYEPSKVLVAPETFQASSSTSLDATQGKDVKEDVASQGNETIETPNAEATVTAAGTTTWAIEDWFREHGATNEKLIDVESEKLVESVQATYPDLNVHLVYAGQKIPLPADIAYQALRNILASQAA